MLVRRKEPWSELGLIMKLPNEMTAGEINRERDTIARTKLPKLNKEFKRANRDPDIATCYLKSSDPLDAKMIALRARWYGLQNEILKECGPGVMKFPPRFRRTLKVKTSR